MINFKRDIENKNAMLVLEEPSLVKYPIANNLKKIKLEKIRDPFKFSEVFF